MEYPDVFHNRIRPFLHLLRSRSRTSPSVSRSSYQFFQSGLRRLQALSRPSIRPAQFLMYDSPTLPTTLVLRDGRISGSGLNKESRLDAWKSIPTDPESITYGSRIKGTCEGPLSTSVPERQVQRSGSRGHGAGVLIPSFRRHRHRSCRTRCWRCGKGRCIFDGCRTRLRRMRVARREHAATADRWLDWRVGWVGRTGFFAPWMRPWTALTDISSAVDLLACHPGPVLPARCIVHPGVITKAVAPSCQAQLPLAHSGILLRSALSPILSDIGAGSTMAERGGCDRAVLHLSVCLSTKNLRVSAPSNLRNNS